MRLIQLAFRSPFKIPNQRFCRNCITISNKYNTLEMMIWTAVVIFHF